MKKIFALLCVGLLLLPAYPCHAFFSQANLTTEEEKDLGKEFMVYVKKQFVFVEDPSIVDYVRKVAEHIVAQNPSPPFDCHFYVIKEEVYNAFAGPAGNVFINSGLLAAMENEDQLAGILAHELAHVFGRHISEQISQSKKIGLATLAGILAGVFLGGGGGAASAVATTSVAVGKSLSLQYSREHEMEADQVGLKYLSMAGYSGEGLLRVLQKIREKQWFGSTQVPSYLQTHPAVEDRMAYLDTWIQAHPQWKQSENTTKLGDFRKVRTKMIALGEDPTIAAGLFEAAIRKDPEDAMAYYGKGLLSDRQGNGADAVNNLRHAIRLRPLDGDILRDLGKVLFRMGEYGEALKALRGALAFDAGDPEARFLLGRAQMNTDDLQGAQHTFEALLDVAPDNFPAMYYLGETYGKLGNLAEAHFYLGMYYKEKGPLRNARFHLTRALELSAGSPAREDAIKKAIKDLPKPERSEDGQRQS